MGGDHNFYKGGDYGFEPKNDEFLGMEYKTPSSNISLATDARTANQIKTTTEKLNTGAKAIEVQMTMAEVAESIPDQHLEELNRLRKIIGADFTVHGALVEPTGVTRQGWDETHRQQAERQMWTSLQRAHKLDPDGNVIVTFHSSNGLPEPETKVIDETTGQPITTGIMTVDLRGQFAPIMAKENYLKGEGPDPYKVLETQNKDVWTQQLSRANFNARSGEEAVLNTLGKLREADSGIPEEIKEIPIADIYKMSKTESGQKFINDLSPVSRDFLGRALHGFNYGEVYIKESYNDLQNLFNQAYESAKKAKRDEDLAKLNKFRESMKNKLSYIEDPNKIAEFAEEVRKGLDMLNTIKVPQTLRPLNEFAFEKASETFSNLAIKSFEEFKEKAPIISIENPPAGSGLSKAEDLKALIEMSREKFVLKAREEFKMSKSEAEDYANKLIGATWDVGHINMLKKFGYDDSALTKQTKTIAPFVKHVHLSDNFGMEHTELPMGMGNVPTKAHMDILDKYNKKLKKVIETGNWYQHFQTTPFGETLAAFGSPIYSMQLSPTWNNVYGRTSAGYFSGYGMNPEVHHSIYGSGFSGLPLEVGGQIAGRSRFSGTAME